MLIASLIAVASLYYSDTRKMRREDQRQWDAELRGNYVRIIESLEPLQKTLALLPASAGEADLVPVREGLWEAIAILRQTRLVLDITANRGVVEAVDKLQQKLASMWISAKTESDALEPTRSWGAHHHLELNSLMSVFVGPFALSCGWTGKGDRVELLQCLPYRPEAETFSPGQDSSH